MLPTSDLLQVKYICRLKMMGWKMLLHANRNDKKAGIAMLISDKIDFKAKAVTKDKEGLYIMIKESMQEEDIILTNIYTLST